MSMPRHSHQTLYAVLHSHHQALSPGCYSESTEEIGHAGLGRRAGRWLANYFKRGDSCPSFWSPLLAIPLAIPLAH